MALIQTVDEKILFFFQSIRFEPLTSFFSIFIKLEVWHVIVLLLIIFFFTTKRMVRIPAISYYIAWNASFYWFNLLKDHFQRPRPFLTVKGLVPLLTPHGFSFPSGHATMAAAIATVLSFHFPNFRYVVYTLAFLAGISRVYFGVHYLTDVLAGFLLGSIIGAASLLIEYLILQFNKPVEALHENDKKSA